MESVLRGVVRRGIVFRASTVSGSLWKKLRTKLFKGWHSIEPTKYRTRGEYNERSANTCNCRVYLCPLYHSYIQNLFSKGAQPAMKNIQPFINSSSFRVWCPGHFHGTILHLAIVVFIRGKRGIWILQEFVCNN